MAVLDIMIKQVGKPAGFLGKILQYGINLRNDLIYHYEKGREILHFTTYFIHMNELKLTSLSTLV